jgi:hypothetical protein
MRVAVLSTWTPAQKEIAILNAKLKVAEDAIVALGRHDYMGAPPLDYVEYIRRMSHEVMCQLHESWELYEIEVHNGID